MGRVIVNVRTFAHRHFVCVSWPVQVEDGKKLGEWAGLCKIDKEGNARKVVGCSSVVVKDWGDPDADAIDVLQNYFKTA